MCNEKASNLCATCRTRVRLQQLTLGERVWTFTQGDAKRKLNSCLGLLGVLEAEAFTFKAIRACRATDMAAKGYTLSEITSAGEWMDPKSALFYVNDDVADAVDILRQMIEMGNEEDETEVTVVNGDGG